ncbi:uncharacterized protein [Nicotiana sylvestris]|uniref:uncharacterized protein n=1 Tax=Nicotiana sylvestris TaxID=4096 RepID=UPI00388CAA7D
MDDKKYETYLAAFLSYWLCIFVLPSKDGDFIRPGTFKTACHLACKRRVSLAVPVLARIYKGLNEISRCSLLDPSQTCFPALYVYGWLAHYFKTHFPYAKRPVVPLMAAYSGEGVARYFGKEEARKCIHNGENIIWTSTMPRRSSPHHYYYDGKADESELNFFISILSNYLPLRDVVNFIMEPYSPHRFSRQFGFNQDTPGRSEKNFREASLEEGLRLARICVLIRSKSRAVFPPFGSNMKNLTSSNYKSWWARAHGSLLKDHLQILMNTVELITNTIQNRNEDVLVVDKLPALQSKVVEMRAGNEPMLHKEIQREEIPAPADKGLIPFGIDVDASNKRVSQEESDSSKGDQCWKKKRLNPEGVVEVQRVDSPSRTLTTQNEKANNVVALQRVRPQDIGKSWALFLHERPTIVASVFDGKKVVLDIQKEFILKLWILIQCKLKGSTVDNVSDLEENTKVILEAMGGDDVDIFPLRNLLESLFDLAASYNKTRSDLSDKVEENAISDGEIHLTNAMIEEEEEKVREVSSIRQSLVTVKEKIEKLREKEKNLEALLEVAEKEVEESKLGVSNIRKEYDACCTVLLTTDDLADLGKKKKYLEAMLKDFSNYKLCLD